MKKLAFVFCIFFCVFSLSPFAFAAEAFTFNKLDDYTYEYKGTFDISDMRIDVVSDVGEFSFYTDALTPCVVSDSIEEDGFFINLPFRTIYEQLGIPFDDGEMKVLESYGLGFALYQYGSGCMRLKTGLLKQGSIEQVKLSLEVYDVSVTPLSQAGNDDSSIISAVSGSIPFILSWVGLLTSSLIYGPFKPLLVTFSVAVAVLVVFLFVRYIKKY